MLLLYICGVSSPFPSIIGFFTELQWLYVDPSLVSCPGASLLPGYKVAHAAPINMQVCQLSSTCVDLEHVADCTRSFRHR